MSKEFKVKPPVDPNAPDHYVNNQDFKDALLAYREEVLKAESEGKEKPQVSNYIATCFLKIARGLG